MTLAETTPKRRDGLLAVIDLGSNSVRLVVFDRGLRNPVPLFNEKVICGLGRGLRTSARLNAEGRERALAALGRFIALARAFGVQAIDILGTAAMREAGDGADFAGEVRDRFGLPVTILEGAEESRLAALGITCGLPEADGIVGDLGGGSLDLVLLKAGVPGRSVSLPLGSLWLAEAARGDVGRARRIVARALADVAWLPEGRKQTFFPVGGAWRALGRISISQSGYPLHILDNYTLDRAQALGLAKLLAGVSSTSLERISAVASRRLETLPWGALVLEELINACRPARVVFSAYGMREGRFFQTLSARIRKEDPILGACAALARRNPRFAVPGEALHAWSAPLFPGEAAAESRLRLAACFLSDIAWAEHPDYRGRVAFETALHVPFAGLSHTDRVILALAVCCRYDREPEVGAEVRALLECEHTDRARIIGYALRLGYALSGGLPALLGRTRLRRENGRLVLAVPAGETVFAGESINRRLGDLGRALGLATEMSPEPVPRRPRQAARS